jgi:hypothetical protein
MTDKQRIGLRQIRALKPGEMIGMHRFPPSARDAGAAGRSPTSCSISARKAVSAGTRSDGTAPHGRPTVRETKPGSFLPR